MSQDVWLIVIGWSLGLFSSLIGAIVNNYFQRKQDERKRKWELEDRQTNHSIEAKSTLIKEAKEYLDFYFDSVEHLAHVESSLVGMNTRGVPE